MQGGAWTWYALNMRGVLFFWVCCFALPALSHIELESPAPWFNDGQNKWCPCGGGGDGTRSNADCSASTTDAGRASTPPTTYAPGETITVRFRETIGHTGRMRVAFDPDGADLVDFNAHILADIPDPPGNIGNANQGNVWEIEVTLPDAPCTNCSLQLIQVMNNDTVHAVSDPTGFQTYFQCAAITLAGEPVARTSAPGAGGGDSQHEDPLSEDANSGEMEGIAFGCTSQGPSWSYAGLFFIAWLLSVKRLGGRRRRNGSINL